MTPGRRRLARRLRARLGYEPTERGDAVMPDSGKHESQNLGDYEVLDGSDTLNGNPGDDPLDRGGAVPDHWSAGLKYALRGDESSESLDELLAEEEPDDFDDPEADACDENATDEEVARRSRYDNP